MSLHALGRLGIFALCALVSSGVSADPQLEARVAKLERMVSDQRQSDLLLQIQQLQKEVQDLRGMVEKQQFLLRQQERGKEQLQGPGSGQIPDSNNALLERAVPGQRLSPSPSGLPPAPGLPARPSLSDGPTGLSDPMNQLGLGATPGAGTQLQLTPEDTVLPALPAPETQNAGERDAYRQAFEHLKERNYEAARVAFEGLLTQYPRGDFADNSLYWLGEISYQDKDYPEARASFEQLIQDYPSSPKVPGAMLKLGYLDSDLGNIEQARIMLQAVVRRFPDTAEGRLAAKRLSEITQLGAPGVSGR
ncbi:MULTISPECIES: tol-pal system protein YbgF [Thiorhodovibrio]|uniref:tol-pal system protein YbgF n=1 Tax=Thiorhodovibrio TaxID=61593 RepID=UPI0019141B19|nr:MULTISPECIES: tol-pal system protein YbgF [Thiorhodovibrio]MBK5968688.1 tol-pal system protein YbgF [Thiorhodovibrio winogradskyi]WPL10954.1 tol-pal system protein YbgF [Thiorhodovibrio litoralis]